MPDWIKQTALGAATAFIGAAALAVWNYFHSIANKVDRKEFEKIIQAQNERIAQLESALQKYVTREEFKAEMSEFRGDVKEMLADMRQSLQYIVERIDRIPRQP